MGMNADDRAYLIEIGENPDSPRFVAAYDYLEHALAVYAATCSFNQA